MRMLDTRNSKRRGAVLLEVLVAAAVLGVAGLAALALIRDGSVASLRTSAREEEIRRASALMHAVTLWSRAELDLRLGTRRQGPFSMYIERAAPLLYEVEIRDSTESQLLVATTLYRLDGRE